MSVTSNRTQLGEYLTQMTAEERAVYDAAPDRLKRILYKGFLADDTGTQYTGVPDKEPVKKLIPLPSQPKADHANEEAGLKPSRTKSPAGSDDSLLRALNKHADEQLALKALVNQKSGGVKDLADASDVKEVDKTEAASVTKEGPAKASGGTLDKEPLKEGGALPNKEPAEEKKRSRSPSPYLEPDEENQQQQQQQGGPTLHPFLTFGRSYRRRVAPERLHFEHQVPDSSIRFDADREGFNPHGVWLSPDVLSTFLFVLTRRHPDPDLRRRILAGQSDFGEVESEGWNKHVVQHLEQLSSLEMYKHRQDQDELTQVGLFMQRVLGTYMAPKGEEEEVCQFIGFDNRPGQAARLTSMALSSWESLEAGDVELALCQMSCLGTMMLSPPVHFPKGRLTDMAAILDDYRRCMFATHRRVASPYRHLNDFLVDCLVLGACYPPEYGLVRSSLDAEGFVFPIVNYESISIKHRELWFTAALIFFQGVHHFPWAKRVKAEVRRPLRYQKRRKVRATKARPAQQEAKEYEDAVETDTEK